MFWNPARHKAHALGHPSQCKWAAHASLLPLGLGTHQVPGVKHSTERIEQKVALRSLFNDQISSQLKLSSHPSTCSTMAKEEQSGRLEKRCSWYNYNLDCQVQGLLGTFTSITLNQAHKSWARGTQKSKDCSKKHEFISRTWWGLRNWLYIYT